ncbi:CTLH/CRA C-terminal to lish motif domain-containing protein [Phakopsora pachyrhizi]|nr:CTLH/CRA C-terminal to lish motif domain-containing protein [Phakopsora pachyrhizi]
MSNDRYLTDPSLSSVTNLSQPSNNPISLLNQYGIRRSKDPIQIRRLILDYLCHQCFVDTADAFARESSTSNSFSIEQQLPPQHTSSLTQNPLCSVSNRNGLSTLINNLPSSSSTPVKDHVIERSVRFDTDEDGDQEIGEISSASMDTSYHSQIQNTSIASSHLNDSQNLSINISRPDDSQMLVEQQDSESTLDQSTSSKNNQKLLLQPLINGSISDRTGETCKGPVTSSGNQDHQNYPDWSQRDVQNTRIRLVIKEHILNGRVKEAIKLIESNFPQVLGPSLVSRSGNHSLQPTTSTGSTNQSSFKTYQRLKSNRVPFPHRPLSGPVTNASPSNENIKSSATRDLSPQPSSNQFQKQTESSPTSSSLKPNTIPSSSQQFPHAMFGSLNPAHISLNLQIQLFVEFVRSISQQHSQTTGSSPRQQLEQQQQSNETPSNQLDSSPHSNIANGKRAVSSPPNNDLSNSVGGLSDDTSTSSSTISTQTSSLALSLPHCRALYAYVHQLAQPTERVIFNKELENVSALLAYLDPWNSPVKKYLDQSRRELLAERVNAAILVHLGKAPTSILQLVAQQASFTWSTLNDLGEKIPCPTNEDSTRTKPCNFFNLSEFINLCEIDDKFTD